MGRPFLFTIWVKASLLLVRNETCLVVGAVILQMGRMNIEDWLAYKTQLHERVESVSADRYQCPTKKVILIWSLKTKNFEIQEEQFFSWLFRKSFNDGSANQTKITNCQLKERKRKKYFQSFKGSRGDEWLAQSQGSGFGFKNPLKGNKLNT